MRYENNQQFSTYDRDHDGHDTKNCAVMREGGWWFRACGQCHLNGVYGESGKKILKFSQWTDNYRLDRAEMKVRNTNG